VHNGTAAQRTVLVQLGVQQYAAAMFYILTNTARAAANDAVQTRSRTVPIPQTITPVPGYPQKLVLFKMAASKFWQMRCWMAGQTYRRSTKTTSLRAAQSASRQFYEELLLIKYRAAQVIDTASTQSQQSNNQPATALRPTLLFSTAAAQLYANEQARVERGEFALVSLQVLRNRLDAHILPRFAKLDIQAIDYNALLNFAQFLSKSYTTTTVSQYLIAVRKVLTLAVKSGQLQTVPEFPKIKVQNAPRAAFTPTEYRKILRSARQLAGHQHPDAVRYLRTEYKLRKQDTRMPPDIAWAIGFMVNAFIRPSDLRTLQHRHVEVVKQGSTQYLRLTLPETKRHAAPIVTLQPAVRIYQQIVKQRTASNHAKPTDYLFLPQQKDRAYALSILSHMFNWVLQDTGLKQSAHGKPRTLYSLRHSAITFRLLYGSGIDILTLARNARTSVDVINKHYASTIQPEQNIQMLHSRRKHSI
jgi:hypothetical protein